VATPVAPKKQNAWLYIMVPSCGFCAQIITNRFLVRPAQLNPKQAINNDRQTRERHTMLLFSSLKEILGKLQ
jgi:hypothetical protein